MILCEMTRRIILLTKQKAISILDTNQPTKELTPLQHELS